MVGFVQGGVEQCCTKIWEFRAKRANVANIRQESELEDGARGIDGVQVDREVLQVLCKLFLKLNKQRLRKSRT